MTELNYQIVKKVDEKWTALTIDEESSFYTVHGAVYKLAEYICHLRKNKEGTSKAGDLDPINYAISRTDNKKIVFHAANKEHLFIKCDKVILIRPDML